MFRNVIPFIFIILCSISFSQSVENRAYEIDSEFLKEKRSITVSLPRNYDVQQSYPFVYILDGDFFFDYASGVIKYLADFEELIPNCIVIGIPNTLNSRNRDLYLPRNPTKETLSNSIKPIENFTRFIEKEVFPLIENNYGIQKFKIIHGWSLGSQFSAYIFSNKRHLFDGYILSGFLQNEKLFKNYFDLKPPNNLKTHKYLYANMEGVNAKRWYPEPLKYFKKYETLVSNTSKIKVKFKEEKKLNHDQVLFVSLTKGMKFIFSDFFNAVKLKENTSEKPSDKMLVHDYKERIKKYYKESFSIPAFVFINRLHSIQNSNPTENSENTKKNIFLLKEGISIHHNSSYLLRKLSLYNLIDKNFNEADKLRDYLEN